MKKFFLMIIACLFFFLGCYNSPEEEILFSHETTNSWTLFFYANGDNDLESYILDDFDELKNVRFINNSMLKIFVLVDRSKNYTTVNGNWDDTKLFQVFYDSVQKKVVSQEIASEELGLTVDFCEELDLGNWQNLEKFIDFGQKKYPSDHYAVIIGAHGNGWYEKNFSRALSWDDDNGDFDNNQINFMGISELSSALTNKNIDVLSLDACLMGTIEVCWSLKNVVKYLVATPYNMPECGYNYEILVNYLNNNLSTPDNFSQAFTYAFYHSEKENLVMNYNLKSEKVISLVDYFPKLQTKLKANQDLIEKACPYFYNGKKTYIDLLDLAKLLEQQKMVENLQEIVSDYSGINPHISIYFPNKNENENENILKYQQLDFSLQTNWGTFLQEYQNCF